MNKIYLSGTISPNGISANKLRADLEAITGDVEIHINSGGGSFFEGIEIFNLLREYSTNAGKVTTVNTGLVASAASHIFCAGDTRKAYEHSTLMIHNAWGVSIGNANKMRATVSMLLGVDGIQSRIYSHISGEGEQLIRSKMDSETWYIGKNELLKSGLVTDIITDRRNTNGNPKTAYEDSVKSYLARDNSGVDLDRVAASIKQCEGNCAITQNDNNSGWGDVVKKAQ